jgi:hypothetical protein
MKAAHEKGIKWMLANRHMMNSFVSGAPGRNIFLPGRTVLDSPPRGINNSPWVIDPSYYAEWVSGFIEAESTFTIRSNGSFLFAIGQKGQPAILRSIYDYFKLPNLPFLSESQVATFESIETSNQVFLRSFVRHFDTYPLLGDKARSLVKFKAALNV